MRKVDYLSHVIADQLPQHGNDITSYAKDVDISKLEAIAIYNRIMVDSDLRFETVQKIMTSAGISMDHLNMQGKE